MVSLLVRCNWGRQRHWHCSAAGWRRKRIDDVVDAVAVARRRTRLEASGAAAERVGGQLVFVHQRLLRQLDELVLGVGRRRRDGGERSERVGVRVVSKVKAELRRIG
jgi:hypothetical protein